ncbi:MAG: NADH-quinone oxidoreductase subunit M [Verrucomicrobiales bacterium]|nr:NADH-quinone oxidoreductase subunit M [Verrucomicrobiales bacterium]
MKPPLITLLTLAPLLGAMVVGFGLAGNGRGAMARTVALGWQVAILVGALVLAVLFDAGTGAMQWVERAAWVPSLGVEYHVGLDGLGLVSILLAAAVPLLASLMSTGVDRGREALYYAMLLLLQCGLFGTFTAQNFFHWFLFWEISLVPAYVLVRLFGGSKAGPASFQFFVYTMVGSVAMLLGFLALYAATGSFDFSELARWGRSGRLGAALAEKLPWADGLASGDHLVWWVFGGVLLGFAVKVPLWPFHTWLPDTYTQAPTPVTMVLTGVMSKMGVYGLLRIVAPIFPEQLRGAQEILVVLALATILLPTLAAFAENDLKRVLAYSSINHLGYCLLAVFTVIPGTQGGNWMDLAGAPALNGLILQMLNHGLTAAALFAFVATLERRTGGVRDLDQFGGLRRVAPVFCGLMGISMFASIGLPGLNGFVSEFLIFKGVFAVAPGAASIAVLGLLTTAVFLLGAMKRMFHGPREREWLDFTDLTTRERIQLGAPVFLMLLLGVYPDLILRWTNPTVLLLAAGN